MPDILWCNRDDGYIWKWDGAIWSQVVQVPMDLTLQESNISFVFGTKDLPCASMRTTGQLFGLQEIDVAGSALGTGINLPGSDTGGRDMYSMPIKYGDYIYWYSFSNGSGGSAYFGAMNLDGPNVGTTLSTLVLDYATSGANFSNMSHARLGYFFPFQDRLVLAPYGSNFDSNDRTSYGMRVRNTLYSLNLVPDLSSFNLQKLRGGPQGANLTYWHVDGGNTNRPDPISAIHDNPIFAFPLGDALYMINLSGQCREVNPTTGLPGSVLWSFQDAPEMKVSSVATQASSGAPFNIKLDLTDVGPYALGAKIVVDPGGTADEYYVLKCTSLHLDDYMVTDASNVDPGVIAGAVNCDWYHGFAYQNYNSASRSSNGLMHSFAPVEVGGKIYIMAASARGTIPAGNPTRPCLIAEWDGVGAPVFYDIRPTGGLIPNMAALAMPVVDGTDIHYVYLDHDTGDYRHVVWSTVSKTISSTISITTTTRSSSNYDYGIPTQSLMAYTADDPGANIDTITVNNAAGTAEIGYSLFDPNSDDADITVEYWSPATGFTTATRKSGQGEGLVSLSTSPAGTAHTFVHDMLTDEGSNFNAATQYRITVSPA